MQDITRKKVSEVAGRCWRAWGQLRSLCGFPNEGQVGLMVKTGNLKSRLPPQHFRVKSRLKKGEKITDVKGTGESVRTSSSKG